MGTSDTMEGDYREAYQHLSKMWKQIEKDCAFVPLSNDAADPTPAQFEPTWIQVTNEEYKSMFD